AQLRRGNGIGAVGALGLRMGDEPPDVAQVIGHGIRAVSGLDSEVIAERPHVKCVIVRGHNHRRTRVVYARSASPNLRSRSSSSRAMTAHRITPSTTGSPRA